MNRLTQSEYRLLTLLVEHGRLRPTAEALGISVQTVKNNLAVIRQKVGVATNLQATYHLGAGDLDDTLP